MNGSTIRRIRAAVLRPGSQAELRIQLWSIYYEPVPMGVGPVASSLAQELVKRGHQVTVVASHPHYPTPEWGTSWRPRRETRSGVDVVELPVYTRRRTSLQRILEESSYAAAQAIASPFLARPDALVTTIPSLMAMPTAELYARVHKIPWVIWLQDMISEAAAATGFIGGSRLQRSLARIESRAFRASTRIVSISDVFQRKLVEQGVSPAKIERIYLPPGQLSGAVPRRNATRPVVLVIGNIGLTQNLTAFVRAFERSSELREIGAELRVTGDGVQAGELRAAVVGDRVSVLGVVSSKQLADELARARIALVSQSPEIQDINLPSKITTYMSHGLPIFGAMNPASEAARMIETSGAGWVADSSDLDGACRTLANVLVSESDLAAAGTASRAFAEENFDPGRMAARFEGAIARAKQ